MPLLVHIEGGGEVLRVGEAIQGGTAVGVIICLDTVIMVLLQGNLAITAQEEGDIPVRLEKVAIEEVGGLVIAIEEEEEGIMAAAVVTAVAGEVLAEVVVVVAIVGVDLHPVVVEMVDLVTIIALMSTIRLVKHTKVHMPLLCLLRLMIIRIVMVATVVGAMVLKDLILGIHDGSKRSKVDEEGVVVVAMEAGEVEAVGEDADGK